MFTRPASTPNSNVPVLLGVGAALLAALALAGVVALELGVFGPRAPTASWLLYAIAIPCYFLLQLFAELILEALWGVPSLVAKAVPVVLLVAFYAAWFVYAV
jgi:hypothetical protein